MHHRLLFFLALSNGLLAGAQTVNLRGNIASGGQPVSGAIVTLLKLGKKDTTGSDGGYAFAQTTALSPLSSGAGMISLSGGVLEFELVETSPVAIEVFDIKSNLLMAENIGVQGAGHYRWSIPGNYPANQLLIIRASIGNKVSTFRYLASNGGQAGEPVFMPTQIGRAMAKAAAAVDSLEVSASGYSTRKVMVDSYDAMLNVSLDRVDNSGDKWGGLKNPAAKSAGCGKATTITTGIKTSANTGEYAIDVPPNYDMNTPHILIFCFISSGGTAANIVSNNFYRLKPVATATKRPTIFIGPSHGAKEIDHSRFNALLELAKANLCIDSTRVFATGYSLGGMMTYSLSTLQQKKIRAAAAMAAANYNVWLPNPKLKEPIAYFGITAMADATCPWDGGNGRGSKYIILEKAADNGCEIPTEIPTWKSGNHVVFEFKNCKSGYPVVQATLAGGHPGIPIAKDPGQSESWIHKEIWDFFMRF